jgi:type IV secretory pathway VirB2 component (pilin)
MKRLLRNCLATFSLRTPLIAVCFVLVLAIPALALQGNSPWENAVNVLMTAFTSTIARGLSLVAIVVSGLTFAFEPSRPTLQILSTLSCTSREGRDAATFLKSWKSTDLTPTRTSSTTQPSFFRGGTQHE